MTAATNGAFHVKHLSRLLAALSLAALLGACAQMQAFQQKVENAVSALSSAEVSYRDVTAGIAAFEGLQKIGETYLRQPTCTATSGPICHDRRATKPIRAAFVTGRKARNDALAYMDAHPCNNAPACPLMPDGVYAGLRSAITELQDLYSVYKVQMGAN